MIPRECQRLAEVDFPIAEVSKHAAREKSIRQGHPSALHLWWARRPLASSRAVLLALLLPDPCDPRCPDAFKRQARDIIGEVRQAPSSDAELRMALLWFIGAFANWDMAAHPTYLRVGRSLVQAAHGGEAPLVVDPFAGGGSIPIEALRLGCDAFASDLNPVACLILKVMLEDIPRHGRGLADELRRVGADIKRQAERELADLYPADLRRRHANRLSVGADGALRGAELRSGDSAAALVLAVPEAETHAGAAVSSGAPAGRAAGGPFRGVHAQGRRRGVQRYGGAGQGDVRVLWLGAPARTGASAACGAARRC